MLLNYANTLIVETNGLLHTLFSAYLFVKLLSLLVLLSLLLLLLFIYLFILEQLRYQTTELNRHLRRRLLTWLIVKLCFFFLYRG